MSSDPVTLDTLFGLLRTVLERLDVLDVRLVILESKPPPPTAAPTPSIAPPSRGGSTHKKARAPRKAKSTAPTIPSATTVPSFSIRTTTTLPVALEKIAVTVSILDDLAGHIIGREGTGLCQIHNISNAKLSVYPTLVSGVRLVSARGSSREVGDALTIIGKRLAGRRVRTPKKKTPSAPAASTSTAPEGSLPSTSPSATIHPMQVRVRATGSWT